MPGINSLRARPESGRPRIRSPARKISRRYSSAVLADASAVKYAAISNKSCSASGDQISARLSPGISPARPPDHVLYLEFPARAFVKRLNALGEMGAKAAELLDVGEQLAADLFLHLAGQFFHLRDGPLKRLDHNPQS